MQQVTSTGETSLSKTHLSGGNTAVLLVEGGGLCGGGFDEVDVLCQVALGSSHLCENALSRSLRKEFCNGEQR